MRSRTPAERGQRCGRGRCPGANQRHRGADAASGYSEAVAQPQVSMIRGRQPPGGSHNARTGLEFLDDDGVRLKRSAVAIEDPGQPLETRSVAIRMAWRQPSARLPRLGAQRMTGRAPIECSITFQGASAAVHYDGSCQVRHSRKRPGRKAGALTPPRVVAGYLRFCSRLPPRWDRAPARYPLGDLALRRRYLQTSSQHNRCRVVLSLAG